MTGTVALVASTTGDEGAPLIAARLRHLMDAGWDAWLFCKGDRWRDELALRDDGLRERVALAPDAKADSSPFDERLEDLHPDLVHFHSGWAAFKGLRKGRLPEARIVIRFRADGQDLAVPDPDLLWQRAHRLVFPDQHTLERALKQGCPPERATVMHAPVEPPTENNRLRKPGTLRILSVGPLVWEQGFEHSIHAVRLLLDEGVHCEYRIVGDGDHVQAVSFARHQLGLGEHVQLIAPDGDGQLPEELRSADVFVDPAVADGLSPTALAAAQANAVPFVATARTAPLSDEAGITVPRRDPRAIADALARIAGDDALRERMEEAGPLVAGISRTDHLLALERLYEAVLAEGTR